jgi:hypothetical protein
MEPIKYQGIDPEAIIDIQVSGHFYKRIVNALLILGDSKTPDDFKKTLEGLKTDSQPKDGYELNIHILTALVYEIESKAKAQNKLKEITFDPETEKFT